MPGQPLPIVYPELGEPIATALSKLLAAIQILQLDAEPKVLGSELQWLADFSAAGHALTDLSQIQLDNIASAVGLETGTVFMQSGELAVQTSSGVVQLTSGGVINASSLGGIVGDYGGSNPARVTYTDATDTYTFTGDTNDWSDLEVSAVKLKNSTDWTTLSTNATGAQAWVFGVANTSGTALVRQSAAGTLNVSSTVSVALPMSANVTFSGSGKVAHGTRTRTMIAKAVGSITNGGQFGNGVVASAPAMALTLETPAAQEWERIIGYTVHIRKLNASNSAFTPQRIDASASATPAADGSVVNSTTVGYVAAFCALTTPRTFASDEVFTVAYSGGTTGDTISAVTLHYDSV
jgi:hypothetical protein